MSKWSERSTWLSAVAVIALLAFLVLTRGVDYTVIDSDWTTPLLAAFAVAAIATLGAVACGVRALVVREGKAAWFAGIGVLFSIGLMLWMAGWMIASVTRFSPSAY